jgi:hypothetical protein
VAERAPGHIRLLRVRSGSSDPLPRRTQHPDRADQQARCNPARPLLRTTQSAPRRIDWVRVLSVSGTDRCCPVRRQAAAARSSQGPVLPLGEWICKWANDTCFEANHAASTRRAHSRVAPLDDQPVAHTHTPAPLVLALGFTPSGRGRAAQRRHAVTLVTASLARAGSGRSCSRPLRCRRYRYRRASSQTNS